ncbi:hypothetical protein KX729_24580 [Rhizobium sp. XQZ8]|uniref:hypothetical protein n=1 Tax=Rhizobium populisoli TaxID=2859785 RepID=UPI001CA475EF|nr:hypothetical protein [Rhizobium populisoli]MBW6424632.1 hypothetical protein [Rhizobium populisoli]
MLMKLLSSSFVALAIAGSAAAQTAPAAPSSPPPGVTVITPDANSGTSTVTPLPGVVDPTTTNSTTGTVDQEDGCLAPGTQANTNPSAETLAMPRPEPACR